MASPKAKTIYAHGYWDGYTGAKPTMPRNQDYMTGHNAGSNARPAMVGSGHERQTTESREPRHTGGQGQQ